MQRKASNSDVLISSAKHRKGGKSKQKRLEKQMDESCGSLILKRQNIQLASKSKGLANIAENSAP